MPQPFPPDFDAPTADLCRHVAPFTMTSKYAVYALRLAVQYIVASRIPGDIVECGVWKGGSMMAVAKTLLELSSTDRTLHLFDTFEQMSEPTAVDRTVNGQSAAEILAGLSPEPGKPWQCSSIDETRGNVLSTGYPAAKINCVKGKVEETIPSAAPAQIALLRLDTDWFESTYHELTLLYPRLSIGGVLIIDDYGYWQGARKAVDQYIHEQKLQLLLTRVDDSARMCIKMRS
jgi:O-methyltransferase